MKTPDTALCKHGVPINQHCRPCEDEWIDREERRLENLPEMEPEPQKPRWVQPELPGTA